MRVFIFLLHYRRAPGGVEPSWSHDHAQEVRRPSTAPATVRHPSKFFFFSADPPLLPTLPFMEPLFLECADDMKWGLLLVAVRVHSQCFSPETMSRASLTGLGTCCVATLFFLDFGFFFFFFNKNALTQNRICGQVIVGADLMLGKQDSIQSAREMIQRQCWA